MRSKCLYLLHVLILLHITTTTTIQGKWIPKNMRKERISSMPMRKVPRREETKRESSSTKDGPKRFMKRYSPHRTIVECSCLRTIPTKVLTLQWRSSKESLSFSRLYVSVIYNYHVTKTSKRKQTGTSR